MGKIIAGTGHRPKDCSHNEVEIRCLVRNKLREVPEIDAFITGMAAGFDLWAADEARLLGIEVWAARPWTNHNAGIENQDLYDTIIDYASKVVVVVESDTYPGHWCMYKRNEWMVDNATHVLAYWNPEKNTGGTYACLNYANKKKVPVAHLFNKPPF